MPAPRSGGTTIQFTSIPPNGGGMTVRFPAYIDSISDSYNGSWDEHKDMGRADPKFMYNQYSRNISISFKSAALRSGEHTKWIDAINSLTDMTRPDYVTDIGYNGVLCRMTVSPLLNVIGFIESVTVDIDNETPWIDLLPLYVSLSVQFRAIEDVKPQYGKLGGLRTGQFDPGETQ